MFRPSAPASLPLSDSFTLRYVTASSSATNFTPTMASSEDPPSITITLLLRLGHGCRSYNQPGMQTALHRVRSRTFIAHPPPIPHGIRKDIGLRYSTVPRPFREAYQRFTPSLSDKFDLGFLQIPHWLTFTGVSLLGQLL